MTGESANGGGKSGPVLIPQKHGGALLSGGQKGQTPGPGRPRDELRAMLRNFAWEKFPTMHAQWATLTFDQQQRVIEMGLKYGLGTQTEAVTPDDLKDAATRIVGEVVTILLDEEHWPREKVQAVAARMTRAAEGNHSREGR